MTTLNNNEGYDVKNFFWFSSGLLILAICIFGSCYVVKQKRRNDQLDKFYYDTLIQIYFMKNGPIDFDNREHQSKAALKELENNMFRDGYTIAEVSAFKNKAENTMQELMDEAKQEVK